MYPPNTKTQILNEPLWLNKFLTYKLGDGNRSLFLKNWYAAGYKVVGDIWDFDTRTWKAKDHFENSVHLFTDLQYQRVVSSVAKYENKLKSMNQNLIDYSAKIKTKMGTKLLENIRSKDIYDILVQEKSTPPSHEEKMCQIFDCDLDWKQIYAAAANVTKNSYLLQTQFRLTHNFLPSNQKLHQWKKSPSPLCICGDLDTNLHYLITCPIISLFWNRIKLYISTIFETDLNISNVQNYFGIDNEHSDIVLDSVNFILLVARTWVWTQKRFKLPCRFFDFLPYLKEQVLIENATKTFKRKDFLTELLNML